jgi:hypothetical protein
MSLIIYIQPLINLLKNILQRVKSLPDDNFLVNYYSIYQK